MAHESPVIYYSLVIGTVGPVLAIVVPSIRESYGYRRSDMIPTTYPRACFLTFYYVFQF
jgi:hypothetical protein